MQQAWTLILLV